MKKVLFFCFLTIYFVGLSQSKQEKPTKIKQIKKETNVYLWMGKQVTYKQFRDSLRVEFNKFCDSNKISTRK